MKPGDHVENDLYNYHLQYLVKKSLVEKVDSVYQISSKGKQLVSNFNAGGSIADLFKVSIVAHVVKTDTKPKGILIQKRLRHPFYGDKTGIAGKVHIGERFEDAAKRKLLEESGLTGNFKFIGVLRKIKRDESRKILEDTIYHHCYCEDPTGKLVEANVYGENFWCSVAEAV